MKGKEKDTLPKVIGKVLIFIFISYIIFVVLFLYTSKVANKLVVKQMSDLSELYIEQLNQEINSISQDLVSSLLTNNNIRALPDQIGPENASWYPNLYAIANLNRNLYLRYGSKYTFYVYNKNSGLLVLDSSILYRNSAYKSEMARALLEKQKDVYGTEWNYLESGGVDYLFSSYENDGNIVGYILNIQDFLQKISLEKAGYRISACLNVNENTFTSVGDSIQEPKNAKEESYIYEIARIGELQLMIHPDHGLLAQLQRLQIIILGSILCVIGIFIFYIRYFYRKVMIPVKEFVNQITGTINADYKESSLWELATVGERVDDLSEEVGNLKLALYEKEIATQRMEIDYFKEQIRPHFFLNCLNLIHSMAEQAKQVNIMSTVESFSEYIRYLFQDSYSMRCVAEEIRHIENYLEICRLRYGEVIEFESAVEEGAGECRIPILLLQTFVENSVKHAVGIERRVSIALYASIEHYEDGDKLYISISDTGKGIPKDVIQALYEEKTIEYGGREHIGIQNAMRRLRILYHGKANISLSNMSENYGAVVEISMPVEGDENELTDSR